MITLSSVGTSAGNAPPLRSHVIIRQGVAAGHLLHELEAARTAVCTVLADETYDVEVRRATYQSLLDIVGQTLAIALETPSARIARRDLRRPFGGFFGVTQAMFRWADDRARSLVETIAPRRALAKRSWTPIGVALAVATAICIVQHAFAAAVALVALRVVGSTLAGGPPIKGTITGRVTFVEHQSLWDELRACLSSHLSDGVVLSAIAMSLAKDGSTAASAFAYTALSLGLFASLARVGSERSGAMVTRSVLERFIRTGSLLAGLVGAWLVPSGRGVALLVPVGGFVMYAALELARVAIVTAYEPAPRWALTVTTTERGTFLDGYYARTAQATQGRRRGRTVKVMLWEWLRARPRAAHAHVP